MKIEKAMMTSVINKLKPAIPKATLDFPRGILFKDGGFFAFNLEVGVKANLNIDSEENFIIPIEALELIPKLPDGELEIKCKKNNRVSIKCKGIETEYSSLPADDYPALPELSDKRPVSMMNSDEFTKQVNATLYAINEHTSREQLRGLSFKTENGFLNVVGTDTYRVSWYQTKCDDEINFLIPKSAAKQVLKIIEDSDDVAVLHDDKQAIFSVENFQVFTRLLVFNGKGIDFTSLFPKDASGVRVNRSELIKAIDRVITADPNNKEAMLIDIKNTLMTLRGRTDKTAYKEDVNLLEETDMETTIALNPKYLKECLQSYEAEELPITIKDAQSPISIDVPEENLKSLLMITRVRELEG